MSKDISKQTLLAADTVMLSLAKLAVVSEGTSLTQICFRC